MKLSYENRVAIVTGAGSGIGRAACLQLAQEGAKIAAVDINAEQLNTVVAEITAAGGKALALVCDISNEEQVKAVVARTVSELGAPYALFNIAGIVKYSRIEQLDLATFNRVIQVNLIGAFLMSQATLPHLVKTRGAIVNLASMAGKLGIPYAAAYSASKGALISLTKSMAKEFADRGVRINVIAPSGVKTPMAAVPFPEDISPEVMRLIPFSPLGFSTPEEIASAALMIASPEAGVMSGSVITIDGAST